MSESARARAASARARAHQVSKGFSSDAIDEKSLYRRKTVHSAGVAPGQRTRTWYAMNRSLPVIAAE